MTNRPQQPHHAEAAKFYTAQFYTLQAEQAAQLAAIKAKAEAYAKANPLPRATFEG